MEEEWDAVQRAFDEVNRSEQVHWVERDEVKSFIGVLILLNTFVLGLETEFCRDKESQDCQAELLWLVLAWFFTSAWSTEMVLRIWVLRMNYFYESLNLVDFGLAWLSIVECWIFPFFQKI